MNAKNLLIHIQLFLKHDTSIKQYSFVARNTDVTVEIDNITEYSIVHTVKFVRNT